jgi:hypothetical protein
MSANKQKKKKKKKNLNKISFITTIFYLDNAILVHVPILHVSSQTPLQTRRPLDNSISKSVMLSEKQKINL